MEKEYKYFIILKKEVVKTLQKTHAVNSEIRNWKGQDIIYLQDDLSDKVNGRVSEKWFYTHLKTDTGKLPRIDMLNMLSEYVGYQNWQGLKNSSPAIPEIKSRQLAVKKKTIILVALLSLITIAVLIVHFSQKKTIYKFCFVDADLKIAITKAPIWIVWLNDNESEMISKCDSTGCFQFSTQKERLRFIVRSPYYKPDTITRIIYNKDIKEEKIQLKTNDYALMIHIFSKSKIQNWKKRRDQLNHMFTNNAKIYQVTKDGSTGMELFNKRDFVNKLTMPLKSLKNIEVIETIYKGDKISILRFIQNDK